MEPGWRFLNSERVPVGPSNSIRRRAQRTERWSKKHLCLSVYSGRKVATAHDCQLSTAEKSSGMWSGAAVQRY